jgi:DNA helicase-2/ATP-dependent DNA helicase PcrA
MDSLNPEQNRAVTLGNTHALVLAGAGSGKTRVLVQRIAHLLQNNMAAPHNIVAVTFTNKAAFQMKQRIETLLNMNVANMWVGTFHGLCHRLLRLHFVDAKLDADFQVIDSDDQHRLIRRILKNLALDEKYFAPKAIQHFINHQKEEMRRANNVNPQNDFQRETFIKVYAAYEQMCEQTHSVDFAELLLRSYELLKNNESVRTHYQSRFTHILVDEFQDTNTIQYAWLKLFIGPNSVLMAVGDDDQSIYGWRGAKIENIHKLQRELPNVELVRLEQNYRSTSNILGAANAVISNNKNRLGKNLWTDGDAGNPCYVYTAFNELDEANFIVEKIKNHLSTGAYKRSECAVLYRANALSRVLEEAFIQQSIPYRIYGGLRFFERAEIKNALAYLRLITQHDNNTAFERIVNVPTRGIGERTLEQVREYAKNANLSLFKSAQDMCEMGLTARAKSAMQAFLDLIEALGEQIKEQKLGTQIDTIIKATHIASHYEKEPRDKYEARVENLKELVSAGEQYIPDFDTENTTALTAFLTHAALEAGDMQGESYEDCVQLMTLHSAKGLEFPIVFMVGCEQQLFPGRATQEDPSRMEEERRLCYVGMTRAKETLYLTHAEYRRLYGENKRHSPSCFLHELPREHIETVRMTSSVRRPVMHTQNEYQSLQRRYQKPTIPQKATRSYSDSHSEYPLGSRVNHAKFGEGTVLCVEGSGEHAKIQIQFDGAGAKWLATSVAKLSVCS